MTLLAYLSPCACVIAVVCSAGFFNAAARGEAVATDAHHSLGLKTDVATAARGDRRDGVTNTTSTGTEFVAAPGGRRMPLELEEDCNGNGVSDALDLVATFRGLGDLPGGPTASRANSVSADGSVVVGTGSSASGQEAIRWVRDGGMAGLGSLPGSVGGNTATGVSGDGSVVVGLSGLQAFRWTVDGGIEGLGHLQPFYWTMWGPAVSADGSLIVGGECLCFPFSPCHCEAFRWAPEEGMIGLGYLPGGGQDSAAIGVSADGSIVVGYSDWYGNGLCDCVAGFGCYFIAPFQWTAAGGMAAVDIAGFSSHYCSSRTKDVSADGSVMVGAGDYHAFRWSAESGPVFLGNLPGGHSRSSANGVSGDGSIVVGIADSASGDEAFVWDDQHGIRSLRAVLVDQHGLDLTGWTLTSAQDVSRDGRTIVGYGTNPDGFTEGWIATLPSDDCNTNGVPDECDIEGGVSRDCNADRIADDCQPEFDADGDGFLDICDACPESDTEQTLRIDGCDTGITNTAEPVGCTLADQLSATCPFRVDVNGRGDFVSCATRMANAWRHDGRISSDDGGRLVACATRPTGSANLRD